jgi:hypothetical protein
MSNIELLIPSSDVAFLRQFSAEIDVIAADELLVRGRMQDHRFAFEHIWRLRTPEYEVIEAGARQIVGDEAEFNPELCERYAGVKGVKIGRGFTKRVLAALGDLPGQREHLWLAIEMARVGQQVYQYTPEFEAQFPSVAGSETDKSYIAWLKDRAYMSLANSCYAYRDETEELFKSRNVRCGFDTVLTRPQPGDKRVFWRTKQVSIGKSEGGFICESAMDDRIHDIIINFELSNEGKISNARSRGLRLPYHGICDDAQLRTPGLNGLRVTANFIGQFADQVGGASGCTHLFDLSIDCLKLFRFSE